MDCRQTYSEASLDCAQGCLAYDTQDWAVTGCTEGIILPKKHVARQALAIPLLLPIPFMH